MKIKLFACKVLAFELDLLCAESSNAIDVEYLSLEYHDSPEILHQVLQDGIDRAESESCYDAVCFGYGLCSNAIAGLHARRTRLVFVRAQDCTSLLLGDRRRFARLHDAFGEKAFWFSKGWAGAERSPISGPHPLPPRYGRSAGQHEREALVFVTWKNLESGEELLQARQDAEALSLRFCSIEGDDSLCRNLLDGNWDDDRFLVVPPGVSVDLSGDERLIRCEPR
jgi:hypothetical protein